MNRLALHWQILIGMVAGSLLGGILNLGFSNRITNITDTGRLPTGVQSAWIEDSANQISIQYQQEGGDKKAYVVSPSDRSADAIRSLDALEKIDPVAAELYLAQGQSIAKQVGSWCKRLGGLFLRMLQMVAVLLIVTSLSTGVMGIAEGSGIGRMFRHTLTYYIGTSVLAIVTGLAIVNAIRPGLVNDQPVGAEAKMSEAQPLSEVLFDQVEALIPNNPLAALTAPNYLSIISFTILFSLFAASIGGGVAQRIKTLASDGFEVMMAITLAIIALAPYGVFFLMASVTATQGSEVFIALGWYVVAVAAALLIHAVITLPLILKFVARRSPWEYARAMSPALLTAFSSASSNGTLPLTISCASGRGGISNKTTSFVLPLGATINMDGTALYEAVAVLFIAQLHFGQNLELSQQIVVAITALLASVGAAGIPHAGLVMMAIILHAVGLPLEMQGVILAVDRVLDMCRTSVNVWSDSCGCAVVETLQGSGTQSESLG